MKLILGLQYASKLTIYTAHLKITVYHPLHRPSPLEMGHPPLGVSNSFVYRRVLNPTLATDRHALVAAGAVFNMFIAKHLLLLSC